MIFPEFIKPGDIIGVTAPSDGNRKEVDFIRVDNGKKQLQEKGYSVLETENVRTSLKGRSSDASSRAEQLTSLLTNQQVKAIIAAKGGDYLMEMLSYLDFNMIQKYPKWMQGYSDVTGLLFTTTTTCDIATIYGNNFNDFAMEPWHEAICNDLQVLEGKNPIQNSFTEYEDEFHDRITGLEGYFLDKKVEWKNTRNQESITLKGRLIGGCLDVLLNLVGTRFDTVKSFNERYKEDGILWYLESFDLNSESLARGLWQLKEAGWFDHAVGFVFGRPAMYTTWTDTTYEEAVMSILEPFNLPIILDADIGHKTPQFTIINGSIGTFTSTKGKGQLTMELIP